MIDRKKLSLFGVLVSIFGIIFSAILISEYYGNTNEYISTACSALGSGDSCKIVAQSVYSAIRDVPVLGDIPVAQLGFSFYGFVGSLFFILFRTKDEDSKKGIVYFLLTILGFGILIDLILLFISITQIKTVCIFCALTYVVTISLFLISYLMVKSMNEKEPIINSIKTHGKSALQKNLLNFAIIFLFFFACGTGIGKFFGLTETDSGEKPQINPAILKAKIEEFYKKENKGINLSEAPSIGPKNALVKIVKYADFNCPHCMHASKTISQLRAEYPNDIQVFYKNFPLDGACNFLVQRKTPDASSCVASFASLCAAKQNKFDEMYHGLYENLELGTRHSPSSVMMLATKIGLNTDKFKTCLSSPEIAAFVNREVKEGEKLKIESTPSLFINDKPLDAGTPNETFFRELIKDIISKNKK